MLESISNALIVLIDSIGLLGIFFATAIESFFPPIPSEIVLASGGFFAQANGGIPILLAICVVAALGNFVGTLPFYLISRFGSKKYLPAFLNRYGKFLLISMENINKVENLFAKRGNLIVFTSRLIPGIRSLVAFPAGIAKMNFFKYTFYTLSGSFLWNLLISGIGFLAYEKKDAIFMMLKPVENFILLFVILILISYVMAVIYQFKRQKKYR